MVARLQHRGPDDQGIYVSANVALSMRRLSIVDIANGQQPMFGAGGRYALVFNGEIYNFRALRRELEANGRAFLTRCDTEVVLAAFEAWGQAGFQKLEGMFGAAVWDEQRRTLTLARDWFGQKSLYWTQCAFGLAFASEIKALLVLPGVEPRLDLQALSHYMSLRYLPAAKTFFAGIAKVPAAHCLSWRSSEHSLERVPAQSLQRLWTPHYEPKSTQSEQALLSQLDDLMRSVIDEHMMSDVPVGAFLSGGIDSSLVVAYAARLAREPLKTFSVGVNHDKHSELPWARIVADRYRTEHHETIVEPDLAALAPRMVQAMEEPVDPFAYGVYVVSQAASRHVKVALGGDGGDELFAGYDRYKGQELAELYAHLPQALRHRLLRPLIKRFPDDFGYNTLANKLRWLDEMADRRGFERYAHSAAFLRFPHWRKQALFTQSSWDSLEQTASEQLLEQYFADGSAAAHLDRMLHADCMSRLADHQLPIADKMSMVHSLELRSPLLDRRIAEFAMHLPASLKLKSRRIKYFTRKLGEKYLPQELLYRPKQGFGFPIAQWLRGELRPLLNRTLEESRLADAGIFDRQAMQRLANEHIAGTDDHNYRLWMLFNIEIFWRHHIEGTSVEALENWIGTARLARAA